MSSAHVDYVPARLWHKPFSLHGRCRCRCFGRLSVTALATSMYRCASARCLVRAALCSATLTLFAAPFVFQSSPWWQPDEANGSETTTKGWIEFLTGPAAVGKPIDCHQLYGLPPNASTPSNMYVGIFSSAAKSYWPRRYRSRRVYVACLRKAGIEARFFVGTPWYPEKGILPTAHIQGRRDTKAEQDEARALLAEYNTHGDMVVMAARDAYMEMTTKLLHLLQTFCQQSTAPYLVKQDDDFAMRYKAVQELVRRHETMYPGQELYAGYYFNGTEYDMMAGADGTTAPFMSGNAILISRRLACLISQADYAHSALKAFYGTSNDDANLGKWVQYASEAHGVKVRTVAHVFIFNLDEVEQMPPRNRARKP